MPGGKGRHVRRRCCPCCSVRATGQPKRRSGPLPVWAARTRRMRRTSTTRFSNWPMPVRMRVTGPGYGHCLEAVSKPSSGQPFLVVLCSGLTQLVGTQDTGGEFMKRLKMLAGSLVADQDAAEVRPPTHGPLDHVAFLAQATAMRLVLAPRREQRPDAVEHHQGDQVREAVAPVPQQHRG